MKVILFVLICIFLVSCTPPDYSEFKQSKGEEIKQDIKSLIKETTIEINQDPNIVYINKYMQDEETSGGFGVWKQDVLPEFGYSNIILNEISDPEIRDFIKKGYSGKPSNDPLIDFNDEYIIHSIYITDRKTNRSTDYREQIRQTLCPFSDYYHRKNLLNEPECNPVYNIPVKFYGEKVLIETTGTGYCLISLEVESNMEENERKCFSMDDANPNILNVKKSDYCKRERLCYSINDPNNAKIIDTLLGTQVEKESRIIYQDMAGNEKRQPYIKITKPGNKITVITNGVYGNGGKRLQDGTNNKFLVENWDKMSDIKILRNKLYFYTEDKQCWEIRERKLCNSLFKYYELIIE